MRRSVAVSASIFLLFSTVLIAGFTPLAAVQGDTEVRTVLCDGSSSAALTIQSPLSDTVLTSMPLTVTGTLSNVTQIEVTVDGSYDSTIPVSANQTSYSTQLTLDAGTHTVVLKGNDVCQVQDPEETIVLTFVPPVPVPSDDAPLQPIVIGPQTSLPKEPAGGEEITQDNDSASSVPILGPIVNIAQNIATALDFDATSQDGGIFRTIARFSLFTLGLGLLLFSSSVLAVTRRWQLRDFAVFQYLGGNKSLISDPRLHDHITRNSILLRLLGVVCIAAALFI